jgi:hypothetical protein
MGDLPSWLVSQLPPEVNPEDVTAYVALRTALDGGWGETLLALRAGRAFALCRTSILDRYEAVALDRRDPAELRPGPSSSTLLLKTEAGREHRLSLTYIERDAVQSLLNELSAAAAPAPDGPLDAARGELLGMLLAPARGLVSAIASRPRAATRRG